MKLQSHKVFVFIFSLLLLNFLPSGKAWSNVVTDACTRLQTACDAVVYTYYVDQFLHKGKWEKKYHNDYLALKAKTCDTFPFADTYCQQHIILSDPNNKYTYTPDPKDLTTCQGIDQIDGLCPCPTCFFKHSKK